MAYESRAHPPLLKPLCFERQDDAYEIRILSQLSGPRLMPCPDLRGDVIEDTDSVASGIPRQGEVESRVVDGDEEVDLLLDQEASHVSPQFREIWQVSNYLGESQNRQPVEIGQQLDPLSGHEAPAETIQADVRETKLQFAGQLRAVKVTRLFARCQENRSARQTD